MEGKLILLVNLELFLVFYCFVFFFLFFWQLKEISLPAFVGAGFKDN